MERKSSGIMMRSSERYTRERSDWETKMDCTKERGAVTTITQSCWAKIENDFEDPEAPVGDTCLVVDYQDNEECCDRVIITLNTLQQRIDTLPPIFEFCYPNRSEEHTSELQSRGHL